MIFLKALPCILSNPCQNGAPCTNNNLGGYTCTCVTGYTGTNCQYPLPCILNSPCLNGATCTNNNLGGYTCTCATGYSGVNCQYGNNCFGKKCIIIQIKSFFKIQRLLRSLRGTGTGTDGIRTAPDRPQLAWTGAGGCR